MTSIGFGLERIGLWAIRWPKSATVLLFALTAVCLFHFPQLRFDGNVTSVLPKQSPAFINYEAQKSGFRNFSRDVAVIIESPRLMKPDGLEDLRFLQLEVAVADGVGNVYSVFSLPKPDPQTGAMPPFLPEEFESEEAARKAIEELLAEQPQARSLISPDKNAALLFVTLETGLHDASDGEVYDAFRILKQNVEEVLPDDFKVHYSGLTPIGLTIIATLIEDQIKLTLIGLVLGVFIAYVVFRSVLAALLCAVPPALTAIWALGLFAITGLEITFLTTVLPTLGLILAFADTIVLYYRWQKSNAEQAGAPGDPGAILVDNLKNAVSKVGPATALTSITTALAFLSFSYSSSEALKEFAFYGAGAVAMALLSVVIGLVIAIYWSVQAGFSKLANTRAPSFGDFGKPVHRFCSAIPVPVTVSAFVAVLALGLVHLSIVPEYKVTDYLPEVSEAKEAERLSNEVFGGRSMIFLSVPVANTEELVSEPNQDRLAEVEDILGNHFNPKSLASLNLLWRKFETPEAQKRIANVIRDAPDSARSGYLSADGGSMLISVRIPSDQSINKTLDQIRSVRAELATLDYGSDTMVSGFPVLMAEEFTSLIEQLRTSLLIAIGLGIIIIGFATRSPLLTLAAITPNLLPILAVELILYLRGGTINLSEVIALTLAFGIAIDNAVHVINVYQAERRIGKPIEKAVKDALEEIGPALCSSTLIICVATLVTLASALPVVPILGQLIIATLFVALFSNLAILPANILTFSRAKTGQAK